MSSTRCYGLGVMGVHVGKDDFDVGVSPLKTPPESTATGAMFWKNMASGWRSLTVLSFLLIRSAQIIGQQFHQCEKTTALTGNGLFWPFEWTGPRSHSSSKTLCFSERWGWKFGVLSAMPNSTPVELGYDLPPGIFSFIYFNTINFNNLFVPDNGRRLGQISGDQMGNPS